MTKRVVTLSIAALLASAPARAQTADQQRYQIGVMEQVLEQAVEHGARVTRDRLQAIVPAEQLAGEPALVRGFRIESYGMFFDVEVPTLLYEATLPWMFRTLDQNDLGLTSALKTLRAVVEKSGDTNLEQALKRVELQVAPAGAVASPAVATAVPSISAPAPQPGARLVSGSAASVSTNPVQVSSAAEPQDNILENPQEAYRSEVSDALMDAMLDHSRGLSIAPGEWLHVAARRHEDRPQLAPADDARTVMIRVRGSDLNQFLAGQITREEARSGWTSKCSRMPRMRALARLLIVVATASAGCGGQRRSLKGVEIVDYTSGWMTAAASTTRTKSSDDQLQAEEPVRSTVAFASGQRALPAGEQS